MPISEEIKNFFQGEVETSEEVLKKYSRDASIFEIRPQAVAFPKSAADVARLVSWMAALKKSRPELSIIPRCAGTDMSGGAVGEGVVADFTRHINKIISIEAEETKGAGRTEISGTATVEPGVFYRDFEKEAEKLGLLLPCYTASKSLNTLGGMAANNSAGEKTLSYGQTKDYVLELEAVLSDGSIAKFHRLTESELEHKMKLPNLEGHIYRHIFHLVRDNYELISKRRPKTSKNAAGYNLWEVWDKKNFDMTKLLVGSQGTLGIFTKIKYRLVKIRPYSELLVMFLKDTKDLGRLVHRVLDFGPETFESYDDHTLGLAVRFLPDMIKKMKGGFLKLSLQFLPEAFMVATGGMPKMVLIAEFTGQSEEEVRESLLKARRAVTAEFGIRTRATKSREEAEKYWTVRRESFSLLRQHTKGRATAPFIDDIIVNPPLLPEFLPKLSEILNKYKSLVYTVAGHMGDGNFHIIPLMDLRRQDQRDLIFKIAEEVYSLVVEYGGSISAEHNDGLIRSPFLEKMFGPEMTTLFNQVKNVFDPLGILNPHKKVEGNKQYAEARIKKSL